MAWGTKRVARVLGRAEGEAGERRGFGRLGLGTGLLREGKGVLSFGPGSVRYAKAKRGLATEVLRNAPGRCRTAKLRPSQADKEGALWRVERPLRGWKRWVTESG